MRSAAIVLTLLLGATTCSQEGEMSHGDPACAFDETGCLPSVLVFEVDAGSEPATAVLHASSPTRSWSRDGIAGAIEDLTGEPGPIAPRVELSLDGAETADLRILLVLPDARLDPVEQLELDRDPQVLRLDNGERYVLELRPLGKGTFSFLTVVP